MAPELEVLRGDRGRVRLEYNDEALATGGIDWYQRKMYLGGQHWFVPLASHRRYLATAS